MSKLVRELLQCAKELKIPDRWQACTHKIQDERKIVDRLLRSVPKKYIYGFNTMPGHRDGPLLDHQSFVDVNEEILKTHCIGDEPYFDDFSARCIGYSRLYTLAAGGSGISDRLFTRLFDVVSAPEFQPLIPRRASYSSGDVIPGAHWTDAVISHMNISAGSLKPGEVMALINGRFVQIGAATAFVHALEEFWCALGESAALFFSFSGVRRDSLYAFHTAERAHVSGALNALKEKVGVLEDEPSSSLSQDSVSVRAFPQILEALFSSISAYIEELNYSIFKPSCNPFFQNSYPYYISQASFLAPVLTTRISAVIDAIFFAASGIVERLTFLLSGAVPGVPVDGGGSSDLALIQIPKLLTSELDSLRLSCGTRWSIYHTSTSYGIEDVASYGLMEFERLHNVLYGALEIIRGEIAALSWVARRHQVLHGPKSSIPKFEGRLFLDSRRELRTVKFAERGSWMLPFFPG